MSTVYNYLRVSSNGADGRNLCRNYRKQNVFHRPNIRMSCAGASNDTVCTFVCSTAYKHSVPAHREHILIAVFYNPDNVPEILQKKKWKNK